MALILKIFRDNIVINKLVQSNLLFFVSNIKYLKRRTNLVRLLTNVQWWIILNTTSRGR